MSGNLLRLAQWTMHSGAPSVYKIECDALTDEDIGTAACLLERILPRYGAVEGIPRGGLRLATALRGLCEDGFPLLIVDDVLTTGASMEGARQNYRVLGHSNVIGAVLFARGPCPDWVTPLFTLHEELWSA